MEILNKLGGLHLCFSRFYGLIWRQAQSNASGRSATINIFRKWGCVVLLATAKAGTIAING
jgi:hypothetical protein